MDACISTCSLSTFSMSVRWFSITVLNELVSWLTIAAGDPHTSRSKFSSLLGPKLLLNWPC